MGADQDRSLPSTPTGQVVSSGARSEEGKDAAGDVCIAHESGEDAAIRRLSRR